MIYRIYSVHGTFAESKSQRGALWWQKESPFSEKVLSYLDTERFKIIWEPFMWSGKNRTFERLDSARKLSRALSQEHRLNNRVAVIAHSHGGNIANSAARIIGRPDGMAFITVGTPFLHETKQGYSRYIIDMWKPLLMILPVLMLALYLTPSIFISRVISWLISFSSLFLFISIMGNIIAIINPPVSSSWIYRFYGLNDLMEEIRGEENEAQAKNLRDPKIYSSHDEAINSLRAAPLQKIILMTPTLASGLATLMASIAFIVLFCVDPVNLFKRLTVASVYKSSVLPIPLVVET